MEMNEEPSNRLLSHSLGFALAAAGLTVDVPRFVWISHDLPFCAPPKIATDGELLTRFSFLAEAAQLPQVITDRLTCVHAAS